MNKEEMRLIALAMKKMKCWKHNTLWEAVICLLKNGFGKEAVALAIHEFNTLMRKDFDGFVKECVSCKHPM